MLKTILAATSGLAFALIATTASAQSWPDRQIRMIIPFPPGGQQEVASRILVEKLSAELGQPIIIESRPGADGNVGTEAVAQSAPDGNTWLGSSVPFTTQVALHPKSLRYNPTKDFAPVASFGTTTFMFTVPADLPVKDLKEFITYIKAQNGKASYAGSGRGSVVHLATEKFKQSAGLDMEMIPYAGQPPAISDLLAGRVQFMALGSVFAAPLVKAGKLKALAVMDTKRNAELPDVPTVAEAGYPDLALKSFFGIHVPKGTPEAVIQRINAAVNKAIAMPDVADRFAKSNVDPAEPNTPQQYGALIEQQVALWAGIVKAAGIETD